MQPQKDSTEFCWLEDQAEKSSQFFHKIRLFNCLGQIRLVNIKTKVQKTIYQNNIYLVSFKLK
jgi:hypothetical protein